MPPAKDHAAQAQHNRGLLAALQGGISGYSDWVVTVAFYAALHRVEAYLDHRYNCHSRDHGDRNRNMAAKGELKPIYGSYRHLCDLSKDSRYRCRPANWAAAAQRASGLLSGIEQHLGSLP